MATNEQRRRGDENAAEERDAPSPTEQRIFVHL